MRDSVVILHSNKITFCRLPPRKRMAGVEKTKGEWHITKLERLEMVRSQIAL